MDIFKIFKLKKKTLLRMNQKEDFQKISVNQKKDVYFMRFMSASLFILQTLMVSKKFSDT